MYENFKKYIEVVYSYFVMCFKVIISSNILMTQLVGVFFIFVWVC